jgi:alkylation response protein AidB-like acyl-CoA dehydrogenase
VTRSASRCAEHPVELAECATIARIARVFIDSRAQKIYAGANEVMKELIARSL